MSETVPEDKTPAKVQLPLPFWEFVAMIAMLMALNALAIDIMLPALGDISEHYQLNDPNDQQWVVFSYVLGFGIPQLFFGPISDRYGRKGLVQLCLLLYTIASFACMLTSSFAMLLVMRFLQGVFAAGVRVIAVSIVRDLLSGRPMAKVMSFIMTVFMTVPILAPSLGAVVLMFAEWRWTFGVLAISSFATMLWVHFRLDETHPPAKRGALTVNSVASAYWLVLRTPIALGYIAASGVIFGALFAFVASSEQIFTDVFDQGDTFVLWFGGVALALAFATFFNARIVERVGMRRISHVVLIAFIVISISNVVAMSVFGEHLWVFYPLFALSFACFGMMGANFSALALEPLGRVAGTASSAHGFATSTISGLFGIIVGGQFNGSVIPVLYGFVGLGVISLIVVWITEKGRLFSTR